MGTCQAHHLSGLSDDECWLLFKQCAFGPTKEEREELVAIGKEIVKKCGGLPLAAQALGGLLCTKSEEKEWLEVKESRLWILPHENSILPALRLSYIHLMPTLKQCFAFRAIFPKDEVIKKKDLIHLWMANGFISSQGSLEVEDVGNMIWNELHQKSFFQDIKINYEGDICFNMHDLIHDLAQGSECMVLKNSNEADLSCSTHHIYSRSDLESFEKGVFEKIESLRTLYDSRFWMDHDSYIDTRISSCFHSLRVLRTNSFKLLSSFANLIHLRYLELYDFRNIKSLPDSIYSLQKLEGFYGLQCLSEHLTCLQNLRHLIIERCRQLSRTYPNIRKLCCLKTINMYIVDSKTGHGLAELRDLNLGGKLSIQGLDNVGSLSEAREANLRGKMDLQELCLSWRKSKSCVTNLEQVIEELQPPSNLKFMEIYRYYGLCFPGWIRNLNNLIDLRLIDCNNCVHIPSLGKLPFLRKLEIRNMNDVQYMYDDGEYSLVCFFKINEGYYCLKKSENKEHILFIYSYRLLLSLY